jgi:hypothetical protein
VKWAYRQRVGSGAAAWRAWVRGDIDDAERLAARAERRQRAGLLFRVDYVRGRYERALGRYPQSGALPGELDAAVVDAWLHLGRPDEAVAHVRRRGGRIPPGLLHRVERPLCTDLAGPTALPFADHPLTPYLPAVDATIDGQPLTVHLDTGGTFLVMGTARAAALGIDLVAAGRGDHGMTRTGLYAGTAGELTLGAATLTNVPVQAMPTLRGAQDVVLIGTNVLEQFLSTVDYPGARLLLSPRRTDCTALLAGRVEVGRVPFHLWGSHYMFVRGGFGARHDLNFFVDSGLAYVIDDGAAAKQACLFATARQYRSLGVPAALAAGPHFDADRPIRLGPLHLDRPFVAKAPGRHAPWESLGGVRVDGQLSHTLLNRHAWTIDFDRREYVFRT